MRAATKSVYLVIEIKCDESSARLIAGSAKPDLGQIMSNEQFRVISLETQRPNFDLPNRLDYFARPAAPDASLAAMRGINRSANWKRNTSSRFWRAMAATARRRRRY
jgi:hypothetical protein